MNTIKRMKLHHFREKIVQDLDVKDIIEYLLASGAINEDDIQEIYSEKVRTDQTRHLLDLLPKKGLEAFDHFVNSLQKDYDWLYKEFTEGGSETDSVDENTFYDAFLLGGVPNSPPYNVKRYKKLAEVQKYLTDLKRGRFVILHGMTGSGKSCLAAAAVDDKYILMRIFKGSVNWLTLGDCDEEELLSHMNKLLQRLKSALRHNSANIVDKVLMNQEKAKEELKRCFLERPVREGLLVLDDVTSVKHIEAFDVGCKIMVITKDLHVMNETKGRYDLIKVNEGFTENESLSLLAKSIDIQVNQLPLQAKFIHNLSQGSPMVMALIAGQLEDNKDDVKCSGGRWEHYVNMLSQKNFGKKLRRNSFLEQNGLLQTIRMSISNLSDDKKKYYKYFALFMEDVNIKPEVLQTLWSFKTKYEVEDIMAYFTKKSLAVCKWNEQLKSSVYGIHDLLLHYLKDELTSEDKIDLHRKLLKSYHEKCNGDFAELPNDNYIYSYIGYHLYHAEAWQLFQNIFMNLKFIQSKLRVTGPADVLGDFKKYRNHIINNKDDSLVDKLDEIVRFIQVHGLDLYKDTNLDIIQCGLLEKKDSIIFNECYEIAKATPQKLYFEFGSDQDLVSQPLTVPIREEIVSACFTNEIYKILVADGKGVISLWGLDTIKLINTFRGHHFKVNHLELHPDNQRFLSCSDDSTLKLWCLDYCPVNERIELNSQGDNLRVFSPQHLQESWRSLHLNDSPKDESLRTYTRHRDAAIYAKFSHSGKEIVSCSKDCYVVWDCESSIPRFVLETSSDNLPTCCSFSWDDSLLFFGGDNSRVNIYNNETDDFVASFCHTGSIVAVLCIPSESNKLIAVSTDEVRIWQWDEPEISNPVPKAVVSSKQNYSIAAYSMGNITHHSFGKKINITYVCAAASSDGVYLVTASSDYVVSVWNLRTETLTAEHQNYSGLARFLDTYVEDNIPLFLCGTDDQRVKIWRLDQANTISSVNLLPNFDTTWVMRDKWLCVSATSDSKNRVQILNGDECIAKSPVESQQITVCAVSQSGGEIFYGCADGHVKKFGGADSTCEVIMKLDKDVIYLQCLQNSNLSLVAAGDINTLKIWTPDNSVLVCYGQTGPVVQGILVPNTQQLLVCNLDAGVKLWDIQSGKLIQVIIGRPTNAEITSADITELLDVLVLAQADSRFHVASLAFQSDFPFVSVNSLTTKDIDINNRGVIQCCKISPHGTLLALGLHTGAILIWNLKTLCQIRKLELHSSPVQSMLFSSCDYFPSWSHCSDMLVTVGEKIGWWNITNLISGYKSSSDSSNANNLQTSNSGEILWGISSEVVRNQLHENSAKNISKKEEEKSLSLLGCIKLAGSHALKISGSPDSRCFLTIDTSGIVYLLRLVQ